MVMPYEFQSTQGDKKMNKTTNKAMVIECYDSVGGDRYWTVAELYESRLVSLDRSNCLISPYSIGSITFNLTKESLDSLVKEAMDKGYSEVVLSDKVKNRLDL